MGNNKRTASMKVVNGDKGKASIEDMFENARKSLRSTLEMNVRQDERFDTLYSIRETCHRFYFDRPTEAPAFEFACDIAQDVKETHEKLIEIVDKMTLDQFKEEQFDNPANALVEFRVPEDWEDVLYQSIVFAAVQPYGEQFDTIHGRIMEEVAKNA